MSVAGLKFCAFCAGYCAILNENRFVVVKRKCRIKSSTKGYHITFLFYKKLHIIKIQFNEMNPKNIA